MVVCMAAGVLRQAGGTCEVSAQFTGRNTLSGKGGILQSSIRAVPACGWWLPTFTLRCACEPQVVTSGAKDQA